MVSATITRDIARPELLGAPDPGAPRWPPGACDIDVESLGPAADEACASLLINHQRRASLH
ncbi:MAG TPA: hypothetical protein VK607_19600, partial [Kofleriaceae bacterium]|nr:hypothetical protein [Kofleriaceae bacterium]